MQEQPSAQLETTQNPCALLLHRPVEEAFANAYLSITWEGSPGQDRNEGVFKMVWLGDEKLEIHNCAQYPWKSNDKQMSPSAQTALRR